MARRKKQTDETAQDNVTNDADDNFGLPEIEYEPLKREEEPVAEEPEPVREETTTTTTTTTTTSSYEPEPTPEVEPELPPLEEEPAPLEEDIIPEEDDQYTSRYAAEEEAPSSVWPKILGVILLLLVVGGGLYYYFMVYKPQHDRELAEAAERERIARDDAKRRDDERLAEEKRLEDERRRADSLANAKPAVGAIERLSERTGRYYVVVASGIDDDLLMDFANKLIRKGYSCMLIPRHGKVNFNRLAIDVKDSYSDAQTTADGLKGGDFGNDIWVVRY